jgi:hypothetical protein
MHQAAMNATPMAIALCCWPSAQTPSVRAISGRLTETTPVAQTPVEPRKTHNALRSSNLRTPCGYGQEAHLLAQGLARGCPHTRPSTNARGPRLWPLRGFGQGSNLLGRGWPRTPRKASPSTGGRTPNLRPPCGFWPNPFCRLRFRGFACPHARSRGPTPRK